MIAAEVTAIPWGCGLVATAVGLAVAALVAWVAVVTVRRHRVEQETLEGPSAPRLLPPPDDPPPGDPPRPHAEKPPLQGDSPPQWLVVVGGELPVGRHWPFAGRTLGVGADPSNEVVVDLPQVSGRHARFDAFPDGTVYVTDLGSSNGTWIGARRVAEGERVAVDRGAQVALSSQLVVEVRAERPTHD